MGLTTLLLEEEIKGKRMMNEDGKLKEDSGSHFNLERCYVIYGQKFFCVFSCNLK